MGSYLAIASVCFLAMGFLIVLVYGKVLNKPTPAIASLGPTFLALCATLVLFVTSGDTPSQVTLFDWASISTFSITLAYYVDAWAAILSVLALFLGLCGQVFVATRAHGSGLEQNWAHLCVLGMLAVLINLLFSASLVMLYMTWFAIGIVTYLFLAASHSENAEEGEDRQAAAKRNFMVKQLIGYAFLGGILFIARAGDSGPISTSLRSVSLSLAPSILLGLGIGAYLGLYPFNPWPRYIPEQETGADDTGRTPRCSGSLVVPLSMLPAIAAIYILGRLYPVAAAGSAAPLSTILLLMGLATIIVASVRAWRAPDVNQLLTSVAAVELGFVAIAFGLAPLHNGNSNAAGTINVNAFSAGTLIFLNCALTVQAIALTGTRPLAKGGASITPSNLSWAPPGIRVGLLIAPWLSLVGLPFTLGFVAKSMLFEVSFAFPYIVIWPIVAIANLLIVIAVLRFLDRTVFAEVPHPNPLPAPILCVVENVSGPEGEGKQGEPCSELEVILGQAVLTADVTAEETAAVGEANTEKPGLGQVLKHLPLERAANLAAKASSIWIGVPWIIAFGLGLMPNQALGNIIDPSAAAIIGDPAGFRPPEGILTGSRLFASTAGLTLAIVFLAFYLYPVPLARLSIIRSHRNRDTAALSLQMGLRYKVLETIVDLIAAVVTHLSALDGILVRISNGLRKASIFTLSLTETIHEDYYFPSLAVLGIILVFIFLG